MRLHVKLKEFLSMFFMAILFFPAFNASLFLPELNLYIQ
ncbi:hypothetical protein BANRA_00692 [Escherichia coli]|uniref:Uncharacterized protein n=1 Tax=Escherichia coli TaxID=562 RepID=A0A3P5DJM8_ECOLX|nr:hypothetical protein SS53G_3839 [Shigella sonnei 53G]EHW82884.1 putative membrane protein [Escherichia coli DEC10D]VCY82059.1 hypothetical protein BANRA_00692 [Escherichia coli]